MPFTRRCKCVWLCGKILLVTGRNEVVSKVMFLHVSVILSRGGGSPGRAPPAGRTPPETRQTPPRPGRPTPDQADTNPPVGRTPLGPGRHPPHQADTPRTRQTPPPPGQGRHPLDQADPQPPNPPGPGRHLPPRKKTAAYGQWAAGTHPTGMHSCYNRHETCLTIREWNLLCQTMLWLFSIDLKLTA